MEGGKTLVCDLQDEREKGRTGEKCSLSLGHTFRKTILFEVVNSGIDGAYSQIISDLIAD
jgi:hypothetical protein